MKFSWPSLIIYLCIFGLSACVQKEESNVGAEDSVEVESQDNFDLDTPLRIDFKVRGDLNRPSITGITNLPSGFEMMVTLSRTDRIEAQQKFIVTNERFSAGPLGKIEGLLPGRYEIEITSAIADLQPQGIRDQLGPDYENLVGPAFRDGQLGRTVFFSKEHIVPGVATAGDIAARRLAEDNELKQWAAKSCAEIESMQGRPTRTPKAQAKVTKCTEELLSELKR